MLTGRGADMIIIDDPLKPEEALSETQHRAAIEWFGFSRGVPPKQVRDDWGAA